MPKTALQSLWLSIKPVRFQVGLILFLILLGNFFSFSIPYFLKLITDYVLANPGDQFVVSDLTGIIIAVAIVFLVQEIAFRTAHYLEIVLNIKIFAKVTAYYFSNLIFRPSSYFEDTFSGKLSRRIEQIGTSTKYFLESFLWEFGWATPAVLVSGALLYIAHPVLFLGFLGWMIVFIVSSIPLLRRLFRWSKEVADEGAKLDGGVVDAISNVPLIHSFSAEKHENKRLGNQLAHISKVFMGEGWWFLGNKLHQGMSVVLLGLILIYLSIYLFAQAAITVGDFVLVASTIPTLTAVIWSLGDMVLNTVRNYGNLSDAIFDLQTDIEILPQGTEDLSPSKNATISFNDVSFAYPKAKGDIFSNFSISIVSGTKVGVVGPSGAGKSTLVKLLLRHYDPQSGHIKIDDQDITKATVASLREVVAFVPQDTTLFHRSLYENILYARPNASKEEVIVASKRAHTHDFIMSLPEQYETLVGERGIRLSGGQRQRIAIARAMLKDSPILVLDEATSALDSESEEIVQQGLRELFSERTVVAVAHRLSTLREMDRIVVIEDGQIVEDGNPTELLQKEESVFKSLWEHQKGGFVS